MRRSLAHCCSWVQGVALDGGGEAALGGEADLVEVDEAAGLLDAALEGVLGFELASLGGDEAEDYGFALGDEAQGLEAARARVVVFEEEAVDVELVE